MRGSARGFTVAAIAFGLAMAGCGKGDAPKADAKSATEATTDAPTSGPAGMPSEAEMQKMSDDAKKAYQQMNAGKDIKAVDPKEMKALLPAEIAGAKRKNVESEHVSQMGMDIATTKCNYESEQDPNDDGSHPKPSFRFEITDLGNLSGAMGMGFTAWTLATYERETDTGYEKMTKYRGMPCEERYDHESKNGSMKVYVAKRFIVEVSGNDATIEQVKGALDAFDTTKLEALVK